MDKAPLLFKRTVHGLMPVNDHAAEAIRAYKVGDVLNIKVTKAAGHTRRNGLYWTILAKACEALEDRVEGDPLDPELLHTILKDRKGLYKETILPSGEVVKNHHSYSFAAMPEHERAQFVSWAFRTLASWIGCTAEELTQE